MVRDRNSEQHVSFGCSRGCISVPRFSIDAKPLRLEFSVPAQAVTMHRAMPLPVAAAGRLARLQTARGRAHRPSSRRSATDSRRPRRLLLAFRAALGVPRTLLGEFDPTHVAISRLPPPRIQIGHILIGSSSAFRSGGDPVRTTVGVGSLNPRRTRPPGPKKI
jgi:hypothetical protein